MKAFVFSKRVWKEILRDPLNLFFGLAFPLILLLLMTLIQKNIPVSLFELDSLTPGICVFGLSFMSLFSATIISKDRSSSFLARLYTTPLTPSDYMIGYTVPLIPVSVLQSVICYAAALLLGLGYSPCIFLALLTALPTALLYISIGLLCGSLFNDKQVGGICGALLTNLSAWLSGAWFDLSLAGGVFKRAAELLPFMHATEMSRCALAGDLEGITRHLFPVLGYVIVISVSAALIFNMKMKRK